MQLKIKTDILKEMISKAIKGAGNNKLIPLTGLMELRAENNTLTITTTDAVNYLYVVQSVDIEDEFSVVLGVEKFSKLISKMTCDSVTLIFHSDMQILEVKGNGTYKIELPLDESGQLISYPNPLPELSDDADSTINVSTIQSILNTIKPSLATTLELPCYTGYYAGDAVIATDTVRIASMNVKLFDADYLIYPESMNLLALMSGEHIDVHKIESDDANTILIYKTSDCIVYSPVMNGIEDYSVDAITGLINTDFNHSCVLDKTALLQVLDRLSIFVGAYDKNAISLVFTADGIQLSSKESTGIELIPYIESNNFEAYECIIDIELFMQEIKAIVSDRIELYYGLPNAIKMVDGDITIIVALLEENN